MPGCRKGDMAVIIKDEAPLHGSSSVGRFVNVREPSPGIDGTPAWLCAAVDRGLFAVWFGGWMPGWARAAIIPDDWLKPIRGLPLGDTTSAAQPKHVEQPERVAA